MYQGYRPWDLALLMRSSSCWFVLWSGGGVVVVVVLMVLDDDIFNNWFPGQHDLRIRPCYTTILSLGNSVADRRLFRAVEHSNWSTGRNNVTSVRRRVPVCCAEAPSPSSFCVCPLCRRTIKSPLFLVVKLDAPLIVCVWSSYPTVCDHPIHVFFVHVKGHVFVFEPFALPTLGLASVNVFLGAGTICLFAAHNCVEVIFGPCAFGGWCPRAVGSKFVVVAVTRCLLYLLSFSGCCLLILQLGPVNFVVPSFNRSSAHTGGWPCNHCSGRR